MHFRDAFRDSVTPGGNNGTQSMDGAGCANSIGDPMYVAMSGDQCLIRDGSAMQVEASEGMQCSDEGSDDQSSLEELDALVTRFLDKGLLAAVSPGDQCMHSQIIGRTAPCSGTESIPGMGRPSNSTMDESTLAKISASREAAMLRRQAKRSEDRQHGQSRECGFDHDDGIQWHEWPEDKNGEMAFSEPPPEYDPDWCGEDAECNIEGSNQVMPARGMPVAGKPEAETTGLTAKQLERIRRNKEQAKLRKAARLVEQAKIMWVPALANNSNPGGGSREAPETADRGGGRSLAARNRRSAERSEHSLSPHHAYTWPNDRSLSLADDTHRKAGFWAVDTVNPNAWSSGNDYMLSTTADVVLTQEVKLPEGYPRVAAEQAARNKK